MLDDVSRRALLVSGAATAAAAIPAAVIAAEAPAPETEIGRLYRSWIEYHRIFARHGVADDDPRREAARKGWREAEERILASPAKTSADARMQLQVLEFICEGDDDVKAVVTSVLKVLA